MATAIHNAETGTPDEGTWVQASETTPSYVKIVIAESAEASVSVLTSETSGPGAGNDAIAEVTVRSSQSVILPAGTYYINAAITTNDTTVDVTVQN